MLYKLKLINIEEDGIHLIPEAKVEATEVIPNT
jgi:hypothetical protein